MVARRFRRELGSLDSIFGFVAETLGAVAPGVAHDVDLVIEELFTNMVKHGGAGEPEVEIGLDRDGPVVTLVLRDFGVEPFDVTQAPPLDVTAPLSERRPGGMGLHLVRQVADTMKYQYRDGTSTITVTKRVEP